MLRIWLAAAAVSLAAPAALAPKAWAQAPQASAAPAPPAGAGLAFNQKYAQYDRLLMETRQLTVDAVERLGAFAEPGGKAEVDDLKAVAQALKARIDAAPPITPEDAAALPQDNAAAGAFKALVVQYPTVLRETFTVASGIVDRAAEDGPKAKAGDHKAQLALTAAMFEGMRTSVTAENLQLQVAASLYMSSHPQHALLDSSVASNKAMIEFFDVMRREAQGASADIVSSARRIRAYSEQGRAAAEQTPALAVAMASEIEQQAKAAGRGTANTNVVVDSYKRSADAELKISDYLTAMALTLAEDGLSDRLQEEWGEIEMLVDRRAMPPATPRAIPRTAPSRPYPRLE